MLYYPKALFKKEYFVLEVFIFQHFKDSYVELGTKSQD